MALLKDAHNIPIDELGSMLEHFDEMSEYLQCNIAADGLKNQIEMLIGELWEEVWRREEEDEKNLDPDSRR